MEIGRRLHPVMHAGALEFLDARQRQAPRLKRADAGGDHHGPGAEAGAGGSRDEYFPVGERPHLRHFLRQMERGVERLRLFEQPIDQLLRAADGQRRNVINRFVRI